MLVQKISVKETSGTRLNTKMSSHRYRGKSGGRNRTGHTISSRDDKPFICNLARNIKDSQVHVDWVRGQDDKCLTDVQFCFIRCCLQSMSVLRNVKAFMFVITGFAGGCENDNFQFSHEHKFVNVTSASFQCIIRAHVLANKIVRAVTQTNSFFDNKDNYPVNCF